MILLDLGVGMSDDVIDWVRMRDEVLSVGVVASTYHMPVKVLGGMEGLLGSAEFWEHTNRGWPGASFEITSKRLYVRGALRRFLVTNILTIYGVPHVSELCAIEHVLGERVVVDDAVPPCSAFLLGFTGKDVIPLMMFCFGSGLDIEDGC